MGGNAIKKDGKSICGRLPKPIYEKIKQHILTILQSHDIICEIVLELPGKDSFGDIDVLFVPNPQIQDMWKFVSEKFDITDPSHIVRNGYVMSCAFDCKNFGHSALESDDSVPYFQIDFLNMQTVEHMKMARFYFSYGDIGAIIGRISNFYGMKFGDHGLWCDLYKNTVSPNLPFDVRKTIGKVMLSTNPREICEFMGFDYDYWKNEIPKLTTKEDHKYIFEWLTKAKFFKKEMFNHLNSAHRDRQETRPFYGKFLESIGITHIDKANTENGETGGANHNYQPQAIVHFDKTQEMEQLVFEVELGKSRQAKFSGKDLIEAFQKKDIKLEGKEVGEKIKLFKNYCLEKVEMDEWNNLLDARQRDGILDFVTQYVTGS